MLKHAIFLSALLSCCWGAKETIEKLKDVLNEIRVDLEDLTDIDHSHFVNKDSHALHVTTLMKNLAKNSDRTCACEQFFLHKLGHLLNNTDIKSDNAQNIIEQLKANIKILTKPGFDKAEDARCARNKRSLPRKTRQTSLQIKNFFANSIKYIQNWNELCT